MIFIPEIQITVYKGMKSVEIKKAENCKTVEDVYVCLKELDEDNRLIRSAEELDQREQEIMSYTNRLAALLLKKTFKTA
jgi:hypothetical protein